MRTGLMIGASDGPDGTLDGLVNVAQQAEEKGFDNLWMANIFGLDAITTLAILGQATSKIGLGTAVTPTYPRHPTAIAQQAMTTGAAANGRFSLGIGLSHQVVIEGMLGFSYDKPARHMREYLSILGPMLKGESVSFSGEQYNVNNIKIDIPGGKPVPLLVAALGPVMLKLTGELADGTITWMTGPKTLENHIIPSIGKGADSAGKPTPVVVAGFPIVLTNDVEAAKKSIDETLQIYGQLPSYRAMLDREGAAGPSDLAFIGEEAQLRTAIQQLSDIGVTDFSAAIVATDSGAYQRTLDFLAAEL
ncbi:MAG TPA: LLM class F420-dependent oxidoreductase [Gammaproteobacteria bacterium]|nr:LLM class F420-dependent oxidoreductase [Gammaproteobacteria bacterium]HIL98470.1 LLM class F420-dependent oxidoreductase [Pseudomonadales bacterium]